MAIREGKWRCGRCSTVVRGSLQDCGSCGWTRDATVKFFLDDDAPVVTDEAQVARAKAGPDWVCESCDNANPAGAASCSSCGTPKGGRRVRHGDVVAPTRAALEENARAAVKPAAPVVLEQPFAAVPLPPSPAAAIAVAMNTLHATPEGHGHEHHRHAPAHDGRSSSSAAARRDSAYIYVLAATSFVVAMLALAAWGVWALAHGRKDVATVASTTWSRSVKLERLTPCTDSRWDNAPPGARNVTHKPEVYDHEHVIVGHHVVYESRQVQEGTKTVQEYRRVKTGTKTEIVGHRDLGNGHFEDVTKEIPVYEKRLIDVQRPNYVTRDFPTTVDDYEDRPVWREKYYYVEDRWLPGRVVESSGGVKQTPKWPDLSLAPGLEREASRSERYDVSFSGDGGRTWTTHPGDEAEFSKFKPGDAWEIEWSKAGSFKALSPMEAERTAPGQK